jgi:hypothetical protein
MDASGAGEFGVLMSEQVLQPFPFWYKCSCTAWMLVPALIARPTPSGAAVLPKQALQGLLHGCVGRSLRRAFSCTAVYVTVSSPVWSCGSRIRARLQHSSALWMLLGLEELLAGDACGVRVRLRVLGAGFGGLVVEHIVKDLWLAAETVQRQPAFQLWHLQGAHNVSVLCLLVCVVQ